MVNIMYSRVIAKGNPPASKDAPMKRPRIALSLLAVLAVACGDAGSGPATSCLPAVTREPLASGPMSFVDRLEVVAVTPEGSDLERAIRSLDGTTGAPEMVYAGRLVARFRIVVG